jgi:hypothetical protein
VNLMPTPQLNMPAEVFYAADGRLVIDYQTRNRHIQEAPYCTFAFNHGSDQWEKYHVREYKTPVFGIHNPWDAAMADPKSVIHCMNLTVRLTDGVSWQWFGTGKNRYIVLNGMVYSYSHVQAYPTGLWVEMLNNTVGLQHRVVIKVPLPHEWWKSEKIRNSTVDGEWTYYPPTEPAYSDMICCPDLGKHFRVTTGNVFDAHGNSYEVPKDRSIVHGTVRGHHLVLALNRVAAKQPCVLTLPRVCGHPRPASSLVFLDTSNLAVIKEMEFVTPPAKDDRTRFYLLAINPDLSKLAAVGTFYLREIDLE